MCADAQQPFETRSLLRPCGNAKDHGNKTRNNEKTHHRHRSPPKDFPAANRGYSSEIAVTPFFSTSMLRLFSWLVVARKSHDLFVSNGLDRIEPRRLDRRIDAENQTDRNGDHECQENGADGHDGGPSG